MRKIGVTLIFILVLANLSYSQTFPEGTPAIHRDSSIISGWASQIEIIRGYINIADTAQTFTSGDITSNKAWFGAPENALGKADGQLVSFGDAGYAIIQFEAPLINAPGPDFAVFSNAMFSPPNQFSKSFVEPAFVEVSSNGTDFERFPAISYMQTETQVSSFEAVEWELYQNFAGLFPVFYGVPFDLEDIEGTVVNINNITHVKIIDAVGCINPEFATYDSEGNIVNSAWPTPFHTGGFDLDAVAVINSANSIYTKQFDMINIYPNPASDFLIIENRRNTELAIYDVSGNKLFRCNNGEETINIGNLEPGMYFIKFFDSENSIVKRFVKIAG